MPYLNFVAARMKSPKKYVRMRYKSLPGAKGIDIIVGVLIDKGKEKTEIQSYRFDVREGWTKAKVLKWLKDNKLKYVRVEDVAKGKEADRKRRATKKRKKVPKMVGEQEFREILERYLKEVRGEGAGVGGPRQGIGPAKYCVCPECGYVEEHEIVGEGKTIPCADKLCPECKADVKLVGSDTKILKKETTK